MKAYTKLEGGSFESNVFLDDLYEKTKAKAKTIKHLCS